MASSTLPDVPEGLCFHCLQPLPEDGGYPVTLHNKTYSVCCYGCQAVAETIAQQNLLHFYQYRDTSNPLQVPLVPEELQQLTAYDDEQLQQQFTRSEDGLRSINLSIDGMTCSACAWLIEQHLSRLAGVQQVQVNATTERVAIRWQPDAVKLSEILQAIAELGYRALPFQAANQEQEFKQRRRYFVTRLGVAGLATMQVMMLAIGLYFGVVSDLDAELRQFMWWISLFMATPVLLYSAQPFYISAIRSIQAGQPNMDVPVTFALLSAYGASAYATFINEGEVYFESVAMFTFFLLVGRYFELLARQKAVSAAANLVKLLPAIAQREIANGEYESVAVNRLQIGDVIQVLPGATIPADGELLSKSAGVNESILTGESRLVNKYQHETVLAGSINQNQAIRIKVSAIQQQTVLASIIELQDLALSRKPKLARVAERMASKFVVRILMLAAATFLIWTIIDPAEAFWVTLSVLVATCPCALALAAPTAVTGAIHKLNKSGILLRNADVLQILPDVKTVFVDKTGTLTTGEFTLQQLHVYKEHADEITVKALAQALENHSEHPLAAPLRHLTEARESVADVQNEAGYGLQANWRTDGHVTPVRIGSLRFIQQWHPTFSPKLTSAQVFLATSQHVLAEMQVGDKLRHDTQATIAAMQAAGIEVIMLTGDRLELAEQIAEQLNIKHVFANLLPADKLDKLTSAQIDGPVAMIGDGLNDGPVLAQADVSITFGHAADLARTAADVVLLRNQFSALNQFSEITSKARKILRQNILWALIYNIGILPVAMAGFVTPYIAAIGMSLSSLIVLLNSLRLYR
ncbi:heavy metal translocating P-type ATPase [Pseudidiomarina marina]|uniref:Copper-translocating P-type ATPase n=1 Tax=Pseudidiomarina marina TaxID=502366 RepID=A0A432YJS0_9GAMM|nr:heavy metal translocating P-type ATPase [Pseudidiomarina marina]RUO61213.1 copper-translocating P-type ATPase [Pseudidiomarina marina]